MASSYLTTARGVMLVYDILNEKSFQELQSESGPRADVPCSVTALLAGFLEDIKEAAATAHNAAKRLHVSADVQGVAVSSSKQSGEADLLPMQ